jgi:NAD(P)-dependent dehydrogenase (short-subunit alcohol dehydrogenase family)
LPRRDHVAQKKVVFLNGGSAGIGRECAFAFTREGATVAVVALEAEAAAELGSRHLGLSPNTA